MFSCGLPRNSQLESNPRPQEITLLQFGVFRRVLVHLRIFFNQSSLIWLFITFPFLGAVLRKLLLPELGAGPLLGLLPAAVDAEGTFNSQLDGFPDF